MSRRKKNNILIGVLSGIVLLMAVGYAAFSSALNIEGTGTITSSWNIQITNIETFLPSEVGSPDPDGYNISEPTYAPTSASFNAGFELPGSMIYYVVEVSNMGSLDAEVTISNLNCGDNEAISCYASAMNANPLKDEPTNGFDFEYGNHDYTDIDFKLAPSTKHYILLIVMYDDVTKQPSDLDANVTLDLRYEQYRTGTSGEKVTIGGQEVPVVTSRDGLFVDEYEAGRYVYKGSDPNNYITFNNETWRIISKEADGTYKIVNRVKSDTIRFDDDSNDWSTSEINTYLNNSYYNNLPNTVQDYIVSHVFYDGSITEKETDLQSIIAEEKSSTWIGNIGLINASDYIKSFIANDVVNNLWGYINGEISRYNYQNSYMTEVLGGRYGEHWTINAAKGSNTGVIDVYIEGNSSHAYIKTLDCQHDSYDNMTSTSAAVAIYLNSTIEFSGNGTKDNPFQIKN